MRPYLESNMTSDRVGRRIAATSILFLIVFFAITTASYFLLPEGLLRNKHPLQNWETSDSLALSTLQIFAFNLLSVVMIVCANLFASRKGANRSLMPLGYTAFFVLITIDALVLGTWSFSVASEGAPLVGRILRTFDLSHRAGLWEMSGQLLVACATAKISLIITNGKETTAKSWKTIRLSKQEIIVWVAGLLLMLAGAFIESRAIIALQ